METIVVAIISGAFSLAGILLTYYLNRRDLIQPEKQTATQQEPSPPPLDRTSPSSIPRQQHRAKTPLRVPLVLWLSVFPYSVIAILLIQSGSALDRKMGYLHVVVAVILAIGSIFATARYRLASKVSFLGGILQIGIMLVLLANNIGRTLSIVEFNLTIALAFIGIGIFYAVRARPRVEEDRSHEQKRVMIAVAVALVIASVAGGIAYHMIAEQRSLTEHALGSWSTKREGGKAPFVARGMSKKQVESILGPPRSIENRDFGTWKQTTYVYRRGVNIVTIVFKDDRVESQQSTLSPRFSLS
jgi:hypothetical protein